MKSCAKGNTHTLSIFQPSTLKKINASFVFCRGNIKGSKLKKISMAELNDG